MKKNLSIFDNFCASCFSLLDADKREAIISKLMSKNIAKIFEDTELISSINSFFENNLNISETSRNSFLHRNTLVYRIEKVHKLTGLDVRKFEDAVSFRLLMWLNEKK